MNATRPSVLIIDYEEEILIALERLLEDAGFDTTTVWTASDALKVAKAREFDLVLVDEYLPGVDEEGFIDSLRHAADDAPVVVMQSSHVMSPGACLPGWRGAVAVVCKWPVETVVDVVHTYCRRTKCYARAQTAS